MKNYRVTLWVMLDIEANSPEEANQLGYDALVNGEIKNRDFMVEAEEEE